MSGSRSPPRRAGSGRLAAAEPSNGAPLLGLPRHRGRRALLLVTAAFFVVAGVSHFTNTEFFVAIVPPYLPAPRLLVYASGVFEILGGVGLLLAGTRRWACWGLLALLAAVYPANLHMAMHPERFPGMSAGALYARLPFQFLFAWCVWWSTRPDEEARPPTGTAPGTAKERHRWSSPM